MGKRYDLVLHININNNNQRLQNLLPYHTDCSLSLYRSIIEIMPEGKLLFVVAMLEWIFGWMAAECFASLLDRVYFVSGGVKSELLKFHSSHGSSMLIQAIACAKMIDLNVLLSIGLMRMIFYDTFLAIIVLCAQDMHIVRYSHTVPY